MKKLNFKAILIKAINPISKNTQEVNNLDNNGLAIIELGKILKDDSL